MRAVEPMLGLHQRTPGHEQHAPTIRIGFTATARINRHDFGVSWNADLRDTGFVVGDDVLITIDVEAERPDDAPLR